VDRVRSHIKIIQRIREPGHPHVVLNDKILVVTEKGEEIDISKLVHGYELINQVSEARKATITFYSFTVEQEIGAPRITRQGDKPSRPPLNPSNRSA
jgi:hypothetical protein